MVIEAGPGDVLEAGERVADRVRVRGQRHRDRHAAMAVVHWIDAGGAGQGIEAADGADHVVAGAAVEAVLGRVADDHVVEAAAQDGLDTGEHIALGVAAGGCPGEEVDIHPGSGGDVLETVIAVAAVDAIGPGAADQPIVTAAAAERIVAGHCR